MTITLPAGDPPPSDLTPHCGSADENSNIITHKAAAMTSLCLSEPVRRCRLCFLLKLFSDFSAGSKLTFSILSITCAKTIFYNASRKQWRRFPPEVGWVHSQLPFHFLPSLSLTPSPFSLLSPFPLSFHRQSPFSHPAHIQLRGLGDRCKLPHRGPGQSPDCQRICMYFRLGNRR